MNTYIPTLLAAGQFESTHKYRDIEQSPLRVATEYELEYYFEDGGYSYINGKRYQRKKGNILVIRPGDERSSILPFRCYYIHFSNVSRELKSILDTLPSFMHSTDYELLEDHFIKISSNFLSMSLPDNLAAIGELFLLIKYLHQLMLQSYQNTDSYSFDSVLDRAQKYIDLCYSQNLTVEMLANKCNVSTSYLYRLFSEKMGTSPHHVLLNRRLTAARSLLMNTDLSLSDIAANSGFNSLSYFSDCFKKQNNGLTPSAFREQVHYEP